MSTRVDSGPRTDPRDGPGSQTDPRNGLRVPAYGPVDALLGYALFYVVVDRATPTVVDVVAEVLPGVSPALVQLGLAGLLWFVLAVTALDQVRRQLAALGVGTHEAIPRRSGSTRTTLSAVQAIGYLALLLVGGAVAAVTFDRGVTTAVSMIRVVATLDVGAIPVGEVVVLVAFFVSFAVATHSLDRLVVGGIRAVLANRD